MDKKAVGLRLKSGLIDRGMKPKELAEAIDMSEYTVKEWMLGRAGMSLKAAVAVCDVLEWPLDYLARRDEA